MNNRTVPVSRETLLQRMRRHYERKNQKMKRAGAGKFIVVSADEVLDKFNGSDVERKSIEMGILKPYEFEGDE